MEAKIADSSKLWKATFSGIEGGVSSDKSPGGVSRGIINGDIEISSGVKIPRRLEVSPGTGRQSRKHLFKKIIVGRGRRIEMRSLDLLILKVLKRDLRRWV